MGNAALIIPQDLIPRSFELSQVARNLKNSIISYTVNTEEWKRRTSIQFVIDIAKTGKLTLKNTEMLPYLSIQSLVEEDLQQKF